MKKIKLFLLIASLSLAAQYCDSGSSSASGAGGPEVTPDTIVEDTATLPAAESSDVYTAVTTEAAKDESAVTGNEDAEDEVAEQPGEDSSEKLGDVVAEEEGDVAAEEAKEETAAETTVTADEAKESATQAAEEIAEEVAKEVAQEVAKEVAEKTEKDEVEKAAKSVASEVASEVAKEVANEISAVVADQENKEEVVNQIAEEVAKEIEEEIVKQVETELTKEIEEAAKEETKEVAQETKEEAKEETQATEEKEKTTEESVKEATEDIAKKVAEDVAAKVAEKIGQDVTAEGEEDAEEETDKEAAEITAGMTIELDTTAGRWYKVEQKDLDSGKSGKYKKNMDSINDFRKKIKDLTANLEKAQKDYKEAEEKYNESVKNSKGKGKGGNNETVSDKERNNAKSKVDGINAQIKEFLDKIDKARDEIGYGSKESGIYTYWANENLRLTVKNVTEPGWYTLRIVAKNYKGNLPAWYKQFNVTVQNETEDVEVGGISIHASDSKYFRGALDVFLDEGDTDLNLLWTNDAYIENSYDANINIKRVTLKWAQKSNKKMRRLVRNAHEYTTVDGRFFWDNNSAWTYWQDQTLGFSFPNLEAGKYEITIMGKNYGELPLPTDYEYFTIAVDADGTSAQAQVPAAMKGWRKGTVVLDITGGTDIMLTWLNDSWKENEYDANFQFKKLMLKRVDESDRSALAAYLLGTKSGNRVLMSGVLLALIGLIAMISLWNRGRAKKQA